MKIFIIFLGAFFGVVPSALASELVVDAPYKASLMEQEVGLQPIYSYGVMDDILIEEENREFLMMSPDILQSDNAPWAKTDSPLPAPTSKDLDPLVVDLGSSSPKSARLGVMSPSERSRVEKLLSSDYFENPASAQDPDFEKNVGLLLLLDSAEGGGPARDAKPYLDPAYFQGDPPETSTSSARKTSAEEAPGNQVASGIAEEAPSGTAPAEKAVVDPALDNPPESDGAAGGQIIEDFSDEETEELEKAIKEGCGVVSPPQLLSLEKEPARKAQIALREEIEAAAKKFYVSDSTKDVVRSFIQSRVPGQRYDFLKQELGQYREYKAECLANEINMDAVKQEDAVYAAYDRSAENIEESFVRQEEAAIEQESAETEKYIADKAREKEAADQRLERSIEEASNQENASEIIDTLSAAYEEKIARIEEAEERGLLEIENKWKETLDNLEQAKEKELQVADNQRENSLQTITNQIEGKIKSSDQKVEQETKLLQKEAEEVFQSESNLFQETAQSSFEAIKKSQQTKKKRTVQVGKARPWSAEASYKSTRRFTKGGRIALFAKWDIQQYKAKETSPNYPVYTAGERRGRVPNYNLCKHGGLCGGTGPWCMAFARYIWKSSGIEGTGNISRYAVAGLYKWGKDHGRLRPHPKKGAFALFYDPSQSMPWSHVGIVVSRKGPGVVLAEGNTSLKRGGDGASLKQRDTSEIRVYIHPS